MSSADTTEPSRQSSENRLGRTEPPNTTRQERAGPENSGPPPSWRVEGARQPAVKRADRPNGPPTWKVLLSVLLVALAAELFAVWLISPNSHPRVSVSYSYFRGQVQAGNVSEVTSKGDTIQGGFRRPVRYPVGAKGTIAHLFRTERPAFADDQLLQLLLSKGTVVNAKPLDPGRSLWASLLWGFGPTPLLAGLFVLMVRRAAASMGEGGTLGGIGKSKARRFDSSEQRTTFADVAGIDEAEDRGGRLPKGSRALPEARGNDPERRAAVGLPTTLARAVPPTNSTTSPRSRRSSPRTPRHSARPTRAASPPLP